MIPLYHHKVYKKNYYGLWLTVGLYCQIRCKEIKWLRWLWDYSPSIILLERKLQNKTSFLYKTKTFSIDIHMQTTMMILFRPEELKSKPNVKLNILSAAFVETRFMIGCLLSLTSKINPTRCHDSNKFLCINCPIF